MLSTLFALLLAPASFAGMSRVGPLLARCHNAMVAHCTQQGCISSIVVAAFLLVTHVACLEAAGGEHYWGTLVTTSFLGPVKG